MIRSAVAFAASVALITSCGPSQTPPAPADPVINGVNYVGVYMDDIRDNPGISVKLSALHPRYERSQAETMLPEMAARLLSLCQAAATANIGLNIDAEEADRLSLSLDVIEAVLSEPALAGWDGV